MKQNKYELLSVSAFFYIIVLNLLLKVAIFVIVYSAVTYVTTIKFSVFLAELGGDNGQNKRT